MKRLLCFPFLFVCLVAPVLGALDFQIPEAVDMSGFGSFLRDQGIATLSGRAFPTDSVYGMVPRSDLVLKSATAEIGAPASGAVVYVQADAPVKTIFSFPSGGTVAILHPESYVSLISGLDSRYAMKLAAYSPSEAGRGLAVKKGERLRGGSGSGLYPSNVFDLRLFDAKNVCWVNPIFLASWVRDRTAPVIRAARLVSSGGVAHVDLSGSAAKDKRITCSQGNYSIYIDAFDTIIPGSSLYSAPYRFLVLLDGKSVIDSSFSAAQCTGRGLSFLENPGPSREAIGADGSYRVGTIALVHGEHDLQVQVSDYAGNTSLLKILIIVP
jgi:hypothetical protein